MEVAEGWADRNRERILSQEIRLLLRVPREFHTLLDPGLLLKDLSRVLPSFLLLLLLLLELFILFLKVLHKSANDPDHQNLHLETSGSALPISKIEKLAPPRYSQRGGVLTLVARRSHSRSESANLSEFQLSLLIYRIIGFA